MSYQPYNNPHPAEITSKTTSILQRKSISSFHHQPLISGLAWDWSVSVRPRTDSWRRCGWCPRTAPLIIDMKRCSGTRSLHLCRCKAPPKPTKLHDPAELLAQQAKSVLALLAPKDVTETRLRVGRVSCAASASASHTFSTKLQLGKKEKKIEIDFR